MSQTGTLEENKYFKWKKENFYESGVSKSAVDAIAIWKADDGSTGGKISAEPWSIWESCEGKMKEGPLAYFT